MLSKRVTLVASDRALERKLLQGAMAAGCAVQSLATPDELPARLDCDLVLYALGPGGAREPALQSLLARLPDETRLIPILPAADLEASVALLGNAHVPAVLAEPDLDVHLVASALSRAFYGDLFGLEKLMPWGVRIYSILVGDYQEKQLAIATIGDFAAALGVRRKYREQIDQCLDEMLMNALYDAPVDDAGRPLFADVGVRERAAMTPPEKAVVQYACDGNRFAIAVRDRFGSLGKRTVIQYLDKCLHADGNDQIDRKASGAGLGLYLIANAATDVGFHVFAGTATEVVCTFDLRAPRAQLRTLAFFEERVVASRRSSDAGGAIERRQPRGRRRDDLLPPSRRQPAWAPAAAVAAVVVLAAAAALVAVPGLRKPAPATVLLSSEPAGAALFVDGRPRGLSPVRLDGLEAGRSYAVRASLVGHKDAEQLVTPPPGESAIRLTPTPLPALIVVESDPVGARVLVDGSDSGKVTPATLELPTGRRARLTIERAGRQSTELDVSSPSPGERRVYVARLPLARDVATLRLRVTPPDATVTVDGLALVPATATRETNVRPEAPHRIRASAPGYVDVTRELTLTPGEERALDLALVEGGTLNVRAPEAAQVVVDGRTLGSSVRTVVLTPGRHRVRLASADGDAAREVAIEVGKSTTIDLGE